ncbi:MAG TPA: hypothetical protein PLJ47_14195 [Candidatus Hydrogenedentes bacterium]|nr:hypothetical protein [Candidatus Hydrogenedentota bacterium]
MTMLAATIQFVVVLRRAEPHERKWHWTLAIIMLAWLLAPFTFAYIKSVYSASVFTHRNLTISLPAVYLIAARGMLAIPLPKFGRTALVAAIAMLAFTRLATSGYYAAPHKDQLREASLHPRTGAQVSKRNVGRLFAPALYLRLLSATNGLRASG